MDIERRKVYSIWSNMKKRCFNEDYKKMHPTYQGVDLCSEWNVFDNFLNWVISQEWKGLSLDKDLLIEDNQTYSPSACVFIDHSLNKFLTLRGGLRGEYPVGVNYKKSHESFVSQIMEGGKKKHLGLYATPMLAHKAWQMAKRDQAIHLQSQQTDSRVIAGLQRIIDKLNNHIENNIETKSL